jgi:hypothetical protein
MPSPWQWDDRAKRYRDTSTGRFITQHKAVTLRDFYIETKKGDMDKLSRQLIDKRINLQQWTLEMRAQVKDTFINEYMLARGGRRNMTQADWGRVGAMLKKQYQFIDGFARDVNAGKVSGGQIQTRARMYVDSGTQAFERAKTESLGMPVLPAYPGDGQTICRANCQCHWNIQEEADHWAATWQLGVAEHCRDCIDNSQRWAPLVIAK